MWTLRSVKTQLILFLTVFAGWLAVSSADRSFLPALGVALVSAVATETVVRFRKTRRWTVSESSVITGLIVGLVIYSRDPWYVPAAAAVVGIVSKWVLRLRGRQVFNPAAFGILTVTVLLSASTQWLGTYQWPVLVPAGLYFAYRLRRLPLLAAYAVTALGIFAVQAAGQGVPLAQIFGYLSYFFIAIMLIEPRTTPRPWAGQVAFGAGVAAGIFALTELGAGLDVELAALLTANAVIPLGTWISQHQKKEALK